jgi:hypothetical protein
MSETIAYSMSCGGFGDGKSVSLWRVRSNMHDKIARFQSDEAARIFAEEFDFPLSDNLRDRLYKKEGCK